MEGKTFLKSFLTTFDVEEKSTIRQIVREFGTVAYTNCSDEFIEKNMVGETKLDVGTATSIPGSCIHAGPACEGQGVRCLSFISTNI